MKNKNWIFNTIRSLAQLIILLLKRLPKILTFFVFIFAIMCFGWILSIWSMFEHTPKAPRGDEWYTWELIIKNTNELYFNSGASIDVMTSHQIGLTYIFPFSVLLLAIGFTVIIFKNHILLAVISLFKIEYNCFYGRGRLATELLEQQNKHDIFFHIKPTPHLLNIFSPDYYSDIPTFFFDEKKTIPEKYISLLSRAHLTGIVDHDDLNNIEITYKLFEYNNKDKQNAENNFAQYNIIRIEHSFLRHQFTKNQFSTYQNGRHNLAVFSVNDYYARFVLRTYPINKVIHHKHPNDFHILIIGFESIALNLLLALIKNTGGPINYSIKISIIDSKADKSGEWFKDQYPKIAQNCEINFIKQKEYERIGLDNFIRLKEYDQLPSVIYLCLPSTEDNLMCADLLEKYYRIINHSVPFSYLLSSEDDNASDKVRTLEFIARYKWLNIVESRFEIINGEILQQNQLDVLAKTIHETYVSDSMERGEILGSRESLVHWEQLIEFYKQDNQAQADSYVNNIEDLGYHIVQSSYEQKNEVFQFPPKEVEMLASAEHHRWLRGRWIWNWDYNEVRDDKNKRHPDMQLWSSLSNSSKEKTRQMIRSMPSYLKKINKELKKSFYVFMTEETQPVPNISMAELKSELEARLTEIKKVKIDYVIVLVVDLDNEIICCLVEELVKDLRCYVVLFINPNELTLNPNLKSTHGDRMNQLATRIVIGDIHSMEDRKLLPGFSDNNFFELEGKRAHHYSNRALSFKAIDL